MTFTNKPKLLVCFHGILIYTCISGHILGIPEGKYVIDLFSDGQRNDQKRNQGGTPIKIKELGSNFFSCQVLGNLPTYIIRYIDIYGNMTSSPLVLSAPNW